MPLGAIKTICGTITIIVWASTLVFRKGETLVFVANKLVFRVIFDQKVLYCGQVQSYLGANPVVFVTNAVIFWVG